MTHLEAIHLWPTPSALARDLKMKPHTVRAWARNGQIPAKHFDAMISAAKRRGFSDVSYRSLAGQ